MRQKWTNIVIPSCPLEATNCSRERKFMCPFNRLELKLNRGIFLYCMTLFRQKYALRSINGVPPIFADIDGIHYY